MFFILIPRTGETHIITWKVTDGSFRTACGKNIRKKICDNTISVNANMSLVCSTCYKKCQGGYEYFINNFPQDHFNNSLLYSSHGVFSYQQNMRGLTQYIDPAFAKVNRFKINIKSHNLLKSLSKRKIKK